MRTALFRFFNLFGPNQAPGLDYEAGVPTINAAVLRNELLLINGDSSQSKGVTYVDAIQI